MKGFKSFSATVCGEEHTKKNKVCQDASMHYSDDLMEIAIVADGHGSDDYFRSHIGAQTAVAVAFDVLKPVAARIAGLTDEEMNAFKNDPEQQNALMNAAKEQIFNLWRERISGHHDMNEFTEEDLQSVSVKYVRRYREKGIFNWAYGTTLIAAVVTKECWLGVQLGDGNCIEYYPGKGFKESMPADPNCVGEVTTSLCQEDALQSFRHFLSFDIPQIVFVHTDGIDDTILAEEARFDVYRVIGASFTKGFEYAVENISANILQHIAKNWKRDDTSLAAIVRMEGLTEEAERIYKERMELKKIMDYRRACSRKVELEKSCGSVEASIKKCQEMLNQMKAEFEQISRRAAFLKESGRKNSEMLEKQKKILEHQQEELEQCNKIIHAYLVENGSVKGEQKAQKAPADNQQTSPDEKEAPVAEDAQLPKEEPLTEPAETITVEQETQNG